MLREPASQSPALKNKITRVNQMECFLFIRQAWQFEAATPSIQFCHEIFAAMLQLRLEAGENR